MESTEQAPPRTKTLHLVYSPPGASTVRVPLDESKEIVFGRAGAEGVDIAIDDPRMSRRHAAVSCVGGVVCVRDLGSRNGTIVSGETIRDGERRIRTGDAFEIGATRVIVAAHEVGRFGGFVIADPVMRKLHGAAMRVARRSSPVLLVGEPGVGKSLFAERIHDASARADAPLVRVECAALRGELSSMFETAHGGTLFLAEVASLSRAAQAKVGRFLQTGILERALDVRVVCSTAIDLAEAVRLERFDAELFERIRTIAIAIPPLRERRVEIPALAAHLLANIAAPFEATAPVLTPEAERALVEHSWPRNVSDLRDVMEYAFALCADGRVTPADLPAFFDAAEVARAPAAASGSVLFIQRSGDSFRVASGAEVSLARRAAVRRILVRLAEHRAKGRSDGLSSETLFEAGWPREKAVRHSADGRVRTAIWTLRRLGVNVKTTGDGYAIDDALDVAWE
jgi:transcriptional regulator with GAF, ATPase, and Fis domain